MYNRDNFYLDSQGSFVPCNPPDREPDYVSKGDDDQVISRYWFETDQGGEYVVRQSDHWCIVKNCYWAPPISPTDDFVHLKKHKLYPSLVAYDHRGRRIQLCGRCYFSDMKPYQPSPGQTIRAISPDHPKVKQIIRDFADRVSQWHIQYGVSHHSIAQKCGFNTSQYKQWLVGKKDMNFESVAMVAVATGIEID